MRLDTRMFEENMAPSREKARALVMAGKVHVNGKRAEKPGMDVKEGSIITITEDPIPYVSRGGLKLQKAIDAFSISLAGLVCADIGASTGGFTDCMLQHGAKKIYAVDVGYGQLDWSLRNDSRVVVMERTNARHMAPDWFAEQIAFASIDVSFISIRLILPALYPCLEKGARVIALIKPQFEAGREQVQKHGVVREKSVHQLVIQQCVHTAADIGFMPLALTFSPITGPKGNIEFLVLLEKQTSDEDQSTMQEHMNIQDVVDAAHANLLGMKQRNT